MKSKALIAMAVAGAFWSAGAVADNAMGYESLPSAADETTESMSTKLSLDNFTGGFKGWGPMANPATPSGDNESNPLAQIDEERDYQQHLAEVRSAREQVWVANAPLRSEYENIGATRSEGRGLGRFFGR
jgi:hypothetical protein